MSNTAFTKLMMRSDISNLMEMSDSKHRQQFTTNLKQGNEQQRDQAFYKEFYEDTEVKFYDASKIPVNNDLETSLKILKKEIGDPVVNFLIKNCPEFTSKIEFDSILRREQAFENNESTEHQELCHEEEFVNISKKIVTCLNGIKTQIYTEDSIFIFTEKVCKLVVPDTWVPEIMIERFKKLLRVLVRDFFNAVETTGNPYKGLLQSFSKKLLGLIKVEKFLKFLNNSDGIFRDNIYDVLREIKIPCGSYSHLLLPETCEAIVKLAGDVSFLNLIDTKMPTLKIMRNLHEREIYFQEEIAKWKHEAIHRFACMLKNPIGMFGLIDYKKYLLFIKLN